jgi:hypothetical protein
VIGTADRDQTDGVEQICWQALNETFDIPRRVEAVYRIQKNEMSASAQLLRLSGFKRDYGGPV